MEREVDRFEAKSDDGEKFTVIEYREILERQFVDGKTLEILGGLSSFYLDDGLKVSKVDAVTFKIVRTDKIIRKI